MKSHEMNKIWVYEDYLAVLGVDSSSNAVDLLVQFGTMMVTLLTGTGDGEGDTRRMPSSNTGNLSETLVRLARQLLGVPTTGHSLETLSLGNSDDVNHLVLAEDLANGHWLLEMFLHPVDLIFNGATVQLDLHDVSLLLALLDQTDLETNIYIR